MANELISREALLKILCGSAIAKNPASFAFGLFAAADETRKQSAIDAVSRELYEQIKWERDIAMEQLVEHGIAFGAKAHTVDAVEVVRCKDCKRWTKGANRFGNPYTNCDLLCVDTRDTDFCSYGERRKENAAD